MRSFRGWLTESLPNLRRSRELQRVDGDSGVWVSRVRKVLPNKQRGGGVEARVLADGADQAGPGQGITADWIFFYRKYLRAYLLWDGDTRISPNEYAIRNLLRIKPIPSRNKRPGVN